jgi:hypothetical protein
VEVPVARTESESFRALERQIAQIAGFFWQNGWADCDASNVSVDIAGHAADPRLPEERRRSTKLEHTYASLAGRFILITISGRGFRDCARDVAANTSILRIADGADGYEAWGPEEEAYGGRPTFDLLVHLRVHEGLRDQRSPNTAVLFLRSTSDTGDASQLALCRRSIQVFEQAGIGYCLVALMIGCLPWPWVGYFRPHGTRMAVGDYVENVLNNLYGDGA